VKKTNNKEEKRRRKRKYDDGGNHAGQSMLRVLYSDNGWLSALTFGVARSLHAAVSGGGPHSWQ